MNRLRVCLLCTLMCLLLLSSLFLHLLDGLELPVLFGCLAVSFLCKSFAGFPCQFSHVVGRGRGGWSAFVRSQMRGHSILEVVVIVKEHMESLLTPPGL
jgi:hypothetical protein